VSVVDGDANLFFMYAYPWTKAHGRPTQFPIRVGFDITKPRFQAKRPMPTDDHFVAVSGFLTQLVFDSEQPDAPSKDDSDSESVREAQWFHIDVENIAFLGRTAIEPIVGKYAHIISTHYRYTKLVTYWDHSDAPAPATPSKKHKGGINFDFNTNSPVVSSSSSVRTPAKKNKSSASQIHKSPPPSPISQGSQCKTQETRRPTPGPSSLSPPGMTTRQKEKRRATAEQDSDRASNKTMEGDDEFEHV
jgi:hypothetical protein